MTGAPDQSRLPSEWAAALARHGYDPDDAHRLVDAVYNGPDPRPVYPDRLRVFRAFHAVPPDAVRAVILGQDPYPQPGKANGLAFSIDGAPTQGDSLDRIFRNLEDDPAVAFTRPAGGDLSGWAEDGVLLINAALTVWKDSSHSHRRLWRGFTASVARVLNANPSPTPFLLLGTHTKSWLPTPVDHPPHHPIPTTHPVAWASKRTPLFRTSFPFSAANAFLTKSGARPIDW